MTESQSGEVAGTVPPGEPDGEVPAREADGPAPAGDAGGAAAPAGYAAITAYLDDAEIPWETGARAGEIVATLPGERKLKTVTSLIVREQTTSVTAFVVRNPDENHLGVYRFLLRRNLRMPLLGYAIDDDGDVWVRGQVPTTALDPTLLDHLMGVVLDAADGPFNELLVLGFLTSMKREWAWRVARGESLANLEAFRAILTGSEDDPAYAVAPLPPD